MKSSFSHVSRDGVDRLQYRHLQVHVFGGGDVTFADVLRPAIAHRRVGLLYDAMLVMVASAFIALLAQVAIPLPFSPVPITGQTFAVLLVGALLGGVRGSLAISLYLMEGTIGLPVFAGGGAGLARLAGPTGGYLIGFIAAAFVVGLLAKRGWDRRIWSTALAMLVGNVLIYAVGLPRLAQFVGSERALSLGLYPFVIGDLLKLAVAAAALPAGWKLLGWLGKA